MCFQKYLLTYRRNDRATVVNEQTIQATQGCHMPTNLYAPAARSLCETKDDAAWIVISFCLVGLLAAVYFAATVEPLDQWPQLILEYNLG
jgi:hypothetical protein